MARLRSPRDRSGRFVNYARTVQAQPMRWCEPASEDEVAAAVVDAAMAGQRLRPVGAGHSWSPIAAPEGVALSLDRHRGVVGWEEDRVRVRAGTRIRDLNRALAAAGRALPILGSVVQQSVAGAVATATHGSSLVHGNLSSFVEGVRLVTAAGDTVALGAGDPRLDGARVHLGALGVLSEVTLRTVPAFDLVQTVQPVPARRLASCVEEIGRSAEYAKVWWMPHTPNALVMRCERVSGRLPRWPPTALERGLEDRLHRAVVPPFLAWQEGHDRWVPQFNAVITRTLTRRPRSGPSWLMLTTPDPVLHYETEATVPLAAGGEAVERSVRLLDGLDERVNFLFEVRFSAADGGWLSPAHGGEVVHVGAYTARSRPRRAYFEAFWREMGPLGARPHWGKEMEHTAGELAALYPEAGRFAALRDELDPERLFVNRFLERVLGP